MLALFLALTLFPGAPAGKTDSPNPLYVSPEMKEFFHERLDYGANPLHRLESLVEVIFSEKGLNFHYEPKTRTALETFEAGAGDCLSFTNLLIALARSYGIDIRYREVEVAPTWSKRGKLVVFNRHVNAIAFISGHPYLVDLFPRVNEIIILGRVVSDDRGFAHFYNNRGADLFARGSPLSAIEQFKLGIAVDSSAPFLWGNLGVAESHMEMYDEAEHSYRSALKLEPDNMVVMGNLAELYKRLGREAEADRLFKRVEVFRDKNPYYHFSLGEEAWSAGRYEEALGCYNEALKRSPKDHNFHHAAAKAYAKLGNMKKAVEHLEKAEKYAPDEEGRIRYSQKLELLAATLR